MGGSQPSTSTRRDRARSLRKSATEAEQRLWWHLRHRLPLDGTYFRRQVALGPYFADFCCLSLKIVVELDGDQHGQPRALAYDEARTSFMRRQGFLVLRFWNHQVFREMDSVLDTIHDATLSRERVSSTLTPGPSPQGRGEAPVTSRRRGSSSG